MKKLLILSALIFVTNFYSQSWDYVGDAGFSISDANYISMDIDLQSNDIFVGYQDIGDEGKLKFLHYNMLHQIGLMSIMAYQMDMLTTTV